MIRIVMYRDEAPCAVASPENIHWIASAQLFAIFPSFLATRQIPNSCAGFLLFCLPSWGFLLSRLLPGSRRPSYRGMDLQAFPEHRPRLRVVRTSLSQPRRRCPLLG